MGKAIQRTTLHVVQGTITDTVSARKLGYYIFWNLRQEHSGLAVDEQEVKEAASRAGIRRIDTAWELFDRNCDQSATLEEVIGSVETVRTLFSFSRVCVRVARQCLDAVH